MKGKPPTGSKLPAIARAGGWIYYPITAMGKPRMTRRDKFAKREVVLRYRAFKDEVRLRKLTIPEGGAHIIFIMPMPPSWSHVRRAEMLGQPHQQKPDKDNLEKALLDALFTEDAHIWDARVSKVWGRHGAILVGTQNNMGQRDVVRDALSLFEI